jgi:hypothetical protein
MSMRVLQEVRMKEVLVEPFLFEVAKGIGYQVRKRRGDIKSFGKVGP